VYRSIGIGLEVQTLSHFMLLFLFIIGKIIIVYSAM